MKSDRVSYNFFGVDPLEIFAKDAIEVSYFHKTSLKVRPPIVTCFVAFAFCRKPANLRMIGEFSVPSTP